MAWTDELPGIIQEFHVSAGDEESVHLVILDLLLDLRTKGEAEVKHSDIQSWCEELQETIGCTASPIRVRRLLYSSRYGEMKAGTMIFSYPTQALVRHLQIDSPPANV